MQQRTLVLKRHGHLKWPALDRLEAVLMVLCGLSIFLFTLSVFLDVVTRTVGHPWLWLQQVTTGFFAWGVFIGMAAATRRNDHLYLVEMTKKMRGASAPSSRPSTASSCSPSPCAWCGSACRTPSRSRQLSHAVPHPADGLHGFGAPLGHADCPLRHRAARQWLARRVRGRRGRRVFDVPVEGGP